MGPMEVRLADKRGFCFGVTGAIERAEQAVAENPPGTVHSLGPVIHNRQVVERLTASGLDQSADLDAVPAGHTVLIRSHGVGPDVIKRAEQRGLKVVDASCVLVKRAQKIVRELHEQGYQVVMIGDRDHPEVRGVIGYAPDVIVVGDDTDLDAALPRLGRLGIVAQTTHSPQHVAKVIGQIAERPFREMKVVNTLCMEVVRRQEAAVALAREVDVMFVLGGLHSANTQQLARLCHEAGCPTYHLESWSQFEGSMASGRRVAGVTAGASTPEEVIQEFVARLRAFEVAD